MVVEVVLHSLRWETLCRRRYGIHTVPVNFMGHLTCQSPQFTDTRTNGGGHAFGALHGAEVGRGAEHRAAAARLQARHAPDANPRVAPARSPGGRHGVHVRPTLVLVVAGSSPSFWYRINRSKRDDLTGNLLGGNKVRKLEFLMADALSQGYDTVITCGAEVHSTVRWMFCPQPRANIICLRSNRTTPAPRRRRRPNWGWSAICCCGP